MNNGFHLPNMLPKSILSHKPEDLNKTQVIDIRDIHEHSIALDVPYTYHHLGGEWLELPC